MAEKIGVKPRRGDNFSPACCVERNRRPPPMTKYMMMLARPALAAIAVASALLAAAPASAEVQYPWCAHYRSPLDAVNCGFVNYPQCMATISGIGGECYENPAYPPPRERRRRR
jgi:hypothetical protein